MSLKEYQTTSINTIKKFLINFQIQKESIEKFRKTNPDGAIFMDNTDLASGIFNNITNRTYYSFKNCENKFYPNITIKAPTGAGKTLLAIETIIQYNSIIKKGKRTGLVVWMVHRDTIFTQTIDRLRSKSDFYRQTLETYFGNNILIKEKGQSITQHELENNIVILFVMLQSMNRANKENLKIFKDDGRFVNSIFPRDDEYDKHKELLEEYPYLDNFADANALQPQVKTSLGNLMRLCNPLIIIDEYHKFFTKIGIELLSTLNPSMVIGFTATPTNLRSTRTNPFEASNNVLVKITGKDLREEEMIKYPINVDNPPTDYSWKQLIKDLKTKRDYLEVQSEQNEINGGSYIRPITLIKAEYTGTAKIGASGVHAEDVKEELIRLGIPTHQIAIKSSEKDELEKIDLLSKDCEIRYIITKYALQEGWDCPFAYVLGLIPNTSSDNGLTQMVGRILRQPYQKKINKLKNHDLDQCYIYYLTGDTATAITKIKQGLENEGLDELEFNSNSDGVITKITSSKIIKKAKIQSKFTQDYSSSLYLPIFWIKDQIRKFSFEIDILSDVNWNNFILGDDFYSELQLSFLEERQRGFFTVDWSEEKKEFERVIDKEKNQIITYKSQDILDLDDLNKSILEITQLPFYSNQLANQVYKHLQSTIELQKGFYSNGTFIIKEIAKKLNHYFDSESKLIFEKLIANNKLQLAMGQTNEGGFRFNDTVDAKQDISETNYLYDKYDWETLNGLENNVLNSLQNNKNKLLWWYRNPDRDLKNQTNFHIQGYRKYKIRPDFVVSKKNIDTNKLEMVYIMESKGRMLEGNQDTIYKEYMFETMNNLVKSNKVITLDLKTTDKSSIPMSIGSGNIINNNIEACFIYQDQESSIINKLFNK